MSEKDNRSTIYFARTKGNLKDGESIIIEVKDKNAETVLKQFDEVRKRVIKGE
ncbi:MAG: hypothetical protein N2V78_09225 [Methanophagales archaeon]|nr:hypothetical protein [Methanophagales archaeon]